MPTPTNIESELLRHRETNNERLRELVDQQYNTEITRPFFLRFSAHEYEDLMGLGRLLFAKGMRLITTVPRKTGQGWRIEVAVKHNLREITQEEFMCDLITMASGVHARYDCWDFLSNECAEQTQPHDNVPEVQ